MLTMPGEETSMIGNYQTTGTNEWTVYYIPNQPTHGWWSERTPSPTERLDAAWNKLSGILGSKAVQALQKVSAALSDLRKALRFKRSWPEIELRAYPTRWTTVLDRSSTRLEPYGARVKRSAGERGRTGRRRHVRVWERPTRRAILAASRAIMRA